MERVREGGVLTSTGCMDNVMGARTSPGTVSVFRVLAVGLVEVRDVDGHCGHCADTAERSFLFKDQVLKLYRWPTRRLYKCVCVFSVIKTIYDQRH